MYGADIERLLSTINIVITTGRNAANSMASAGSYMITTKNDGGHDHAHGEHTHGSNGPHSHTESVVGSSGGSPNAGPFLSEVKNIRGIEGKLYKPRNQVANSLGSPYAEIYELESRLAQCGAGDLSYIGPKHALAEKILIAINAAVDAKYAVITYHNQLQDGYDAVYNGGKKSITQDDFEDGITTGEVM